MLTLKQQIFQNEGNLSGCSEFVLLASNCLIKQQRKKKHKSGIQLACFWRANYAFMNVSKNTTYLLSFCSVLFDFGPWLNKA